MPINEKQKHALSLENTLKQATTHLYEAFWMVMGADPVRSFHAKHA